MIFNTELLKNFSSEEIKLASQGILSLYIKNDNSQLMIEKTMSHWDKKWKTSYCPEFKYSNNEFSFTHSVWVEDCKREEWTFLLTEELNKIMQREEKKTA